MRVIAIITLIYLFFAQYIEARKSRIPCIENLCENAANDLKFVIERLIEEMFDICNCITFITDPFFHKLIDVQRTKASELLKYEIFLNDENYLFPINGRVRKILKNSKRTRCNGYVILISDGTLVSRLLKYSEREQLIDTHGYFLLLYDHRIFQSDLYFVWNKVINVVFIRQFNTRGQRRAINLETVQFPSRKKKFVITKYLNTWSYGKFHRRINHFSQKIMNLEQKVLRVAIFEHVPAVTKESRQFYKEDSSYSTNALGAEFELIRNLAQLMNFKASYYLPADVTSERWGTLKNNVTYSGLIGEAIAKKAMFFIGDLHYTLRLLQFFDLSMPYNTECLTFLTPESFTENSWKLLILPFRFYTWIAVLFTLLLAGGVFHFFSLFYKKHIIQYEITKKENRSNRGEKAISKFNNTIAKLSAKDVKCGIYLFTETQNSMLYTYSMLLLVSLPCLPKPWALRLLIGWWWIYSILIVVAYRASMTATLANPIAKITIDTLSQLAQSSIPVGGWSEDSKEFLLSSSDPYSQEIGNKFQITKNEEISIEKVVNGSFCYYENVWFLKAIQVKRHMLKERQHKNNTRRQKSFDIKHNLHIMEECIINMPVALGMRKNSPLKPAVDFWVQRMIEVGLVKKWLSDVITSIQINENIEDTESEKALVNLHKLHGAIVALGIGYFLSFFTLIGECLHWKYVILKDPQYDKYNLDKFYKTA